MTKNFSVLMKSNNPIKFFVRSPEHPDVKKTGAIVTPSGWSVSSSDGRKHYAIGEFRQINGSNKEDAVIGVWNRHLVPHTIALVEAMQE